MNALSSNCVDTIYQSGVKHTFKPVKTTDD